MTKAPRRDAALIAGAAGLALLAGCSGHGRHTKNAISSAELRMNQIRSATDWEMAESAFLAGDFDRAKEKLERSISLNPGVAQSHELLGRVYLEKGDLAEARRSLLRATILDPTLASAQYSLGIIGERLNDKEGALAHYLEAGELAPTDPVYALAVVEALIDLGRDEQAETYLAERSGTFAYNPGVTQALGHLALLEGDAPGAARLFQDARLLDPDQPDLIEDLARALIASDRPADAAHELERLLTREGFEKRRDLRRLLARCYAELDRLAEARSTYLDIVAEPAGAEEPSVWRELAELAYDMHDMVTLGRAGRRLMALAPQDPDGYVYRALYLRDRGQTEDALEALSLGATRGSLSADGHVLMGLIEADAGDIDAARASFERALSLDPSNEIASTLVAIGRDDESITTFTPGEGE